MEDEHQLPTLASLGIDTLPAVSPADAARRWFSSFSTAVSAADVDAIGETFVEDSFWVDNLALTWDFRSFRGRATIKRLLDARLRDTKFTALGLLEGAHAGPELVREYPDLAFLRVCFTFTTSLGAGKGLCHLVPFPDGGWKAYTISTLLESLDGYPEQIGPHRKANAEHGTWLEQRRQEVECVNNSPTVLIVGAGHTGLMTAARMKYLGLNVLVIERNARVGDNWRNRYKFLCIHSTTYFNELAYLPFPSTWPTYCPAPKMGDWLEGYSDFLELNVWTSCEIVSTKWIEDRKSWTIEVRRAGDLRTLSVKHLVFATGLTGPPNLPEIPGRERFRGTVVHSADFSEPKDYEYRSRKAVVVGACLSGHDIAQDFYDNGIDVTMWQRSATIMLSHGPGDETLGALHLGFHIADRPTDFADILHWSLPPQMRFRMQQRNTRKYAETTDKELIAKLESVGFKTWLGPHDAGFGPLIVTPRGGGHYIDTGTSQYIIDGRIKVKNGSSIEQYTPTGVKFSDGTEIEADIVVFATGFKDPREEMWRTVDPEISSKVDRIWGVNGEGYMPSAWRPSGHEGLWFGIGQSKLDMV
ncbi:FAD/NAD(P)-binding domain-containing protein [Coniophora puteana RWD-64-598 SS2]|uniref:FAD/NAD(P)-binding domain-containing protein n=1 Tax=Coniophora puteana (strain RWD-64-598) TaxID=741705 RepID=A0A5M3MJ70_CONPW|nr:FAD/NAD(P)-binding domain-containing protein [Coniophora puteana RWD-64-598 SS2]EIW79086.1 FAD/NAD(P)-binding domain-containing protein [Coniophora puteana RWD-64-598 SS2]